jgi:hypothetical protein
MKTNINKTSLIIYIHARVPSTLYDRTVMAHMKMMTASCTECIDD